MKITLIVISMLVFLSACSTGKSLPSEYFILSPDYSSNVLGNKQTGKLVIAVLAVNIPSYLDRPQLVRRVGSTQLDMFEYKRWAGDLRNEMQRVLAENISQQLNARAVVTQPWHRSIHPDYQVQLDIRQFEMGQSGQFEYSVQWQVMSGNGRDLLAISSVKDVLAVDNADMASVVSAQSRVLSDISRRIIADIQSLAKK